MVAFLFLPSYGTLDQAKSSKMSNVPSNSNIDWELIVIGCAACLCGRLATTGVLPATNISSAEQTARPIQTKSFYQ
jgi:hypothetical protein